MEVLILQVFVSLVLVVGAMLLFAKSVRARDFEHSDRLSLLPLDDEPIPQPGPPPQTPTDPRGAPCKRP